MIAETISSACFVLLVVGFCCMIKIFTIVKNIRPSRYERVLVVYARDNGRPLSAERELTVYFPQAERGAGQRGTCNNTTYSGSQAIRRQPQMHDERFGWQSKKNIPYVSVQLENHFFLSSQPSTIQAVTWCDIVLTIFTGFSVSYSSQAIEEYWIRNEFPSQAFFLKINCWLFNNYSPKWRWHVVNVYQPVKQRGKQMRLTHLTITCIYIRRK